MKAVGGPQWPTHRGKQYRRRRGCQTPLPQQQEPEWTTEVPPDRPRP